MSYMNETRLYPDMQPENEDEANLPKDVLESYWENRDLHERVDHIKEKCIKYVHQEQWDEDVEQERANIGLPSMVADKTLSTFKMLDGYARRMKKDVKFAPIGTDDWSGTELHNIIHNWIKNTKKLHHHQSEAYGMAAVCDEGFLYIHPQLNTLGEVDPAFLVPEAFECYPDANFKDPIEMKDAEFIDLPFWINPKKVNRDFRDHMTPEFKRRMDDYAPSQTFNEDRPRNTYKNRDGQHIVSSNGLLLGIKRFYRKYHTKEFIVDAKGNVVQEYTKEDKREISRKMIDTMGMEVLKMDVEELWELVLIPEVSEDHFVYNEPSDFQPIDQNRLGKVRWPIARIPFTQVAGKAVGAIRGTLKIQDMRNLLLSALQHHLQTAANGGLLYEEGAFAGDEVQEQKFKRTRNRAGFTGKVANGALKDGKIGTVPKGETAFMDGGAFLESVLTDIIKDISGAEPIMKGQAQSGSPASLFQLQIEQSQNSLMNSTEYFNEFQDVVADILYSFVRQFWTTERIIFIQGAEGTTPESLRVAYQTAEGVLNDPAQGLYTVHKTTGPVTESGRRQALSDSLEVARGLAEIGIPSFAQDLRGVIEKVDMDPQVKSSMISKTEQWQASQGILSEAQLAEQQANTQAAQAQAAAAQAAPAPQVVRPRP